MADVGALLPQIEFIKLLGRGGMGAVYKGRQRSLDRLVAVKILRPEIVGDRSFADRFMREGRALGQRLGHGRRQVIHRSWHARSYVCSRSRGITSDSDSQSGSVGSGWPTVMVWDQASRRARVPFVTQRQEAA